MESGHVSSQILGRYATRLPKIKKLGPKQLFQDNPSVHRKEWITMIQDKAEVKCV